MTLKVQKTLAPGRIIMLTHKLHRNKLGMILSLVKGKQPSYKVLVLSDPLPTGNETDLQEDFWHYMMGLMQQKLTLSSDEKSHEIIQITTPEIFEITSKTLHLNADLIIRDVEKRQMERFRDAPTGQTCLEAVNELRKLTVSANSSDPQNFLRYLHYVADLKVNEQELYHKLKDMYDLKEKLLKSLSGIKMDEVDKSFSKIFKKKSLEENRRHLQYLLSHESLSLYPEYENRIVLLKRMEYVDSQNRRKYNVFIFYKGFDTEFNQVSTISINLTV